MIAFSTLVARLVMPMIGHNEMEIHHDSICTPISFYDLMRSHPIRTVLAKHHEKFIYESKYNLIIILN